VTAAVARLAVLGWPLRFTRSPDLHRAGMAALGRACRSEALPTTPDELPARLRRLAADGYLGCNLTHPLKEAALGLVDLAMPAAASARSVNTIGFGAGTAWGDTTDGDGFLDWLGSAGQSVAGAQVVLLGGGGAARSVAMALARAGAARLTVSVRRPEVCGPAWSGVPGAGLVRWRSEAERERVREAALIVHATPLEDPAAILDPALPSSGSAAVDLRYGPEVTPWVVALRRRGLAAWDGLGMLVHQARRSLALWTGAEVPVSALERAVGWPR
jgi:shikimate dehydrogenase